MNNITTQVIVALVMLLLFAFALDTVGQEKSKANEISPDKAHVNRTSAPPLATPTPLSLALTEAETAAGMKLQGEYDAADKALETELRQMRTQRNEKDLLISALKVNALYGDFTDARARVTAWFTAAQKAHGCEGCLLEKGVFVKPEVKK